MATCVVLTASGHTLINWQHDGKQSPPLPVYLPMLGPLLASLVQFSHGAEFGHVELSAGIHVAMSTDAVTEVTAAVLFRSACASDRELARLKSLVVLRQFVGAFRDDIDRFVAAHAAQSQAMADSYTLTQALEGIADDASDAQETKDEFLAFEREFVASTMKRSASDCLLLGSLPVTPGSCRIIGALLLNAASGHVLGSTDIETPTQRSDRCLLVLSSAHCARLMASAALALHESFSLLYHSCMLKRTSRNSRVGFSVLSSPSEYSSGVLTLLLRLNSKAATPTGISAHIGLRMFPTGVFAGAVMFTGDPTIVSKQEGTSGDAVATVDANFVELQRILMSDTRGARLLRLLRGSNGTGAGEGHGHQVCRLVVGSSTVPESVARVLDTISHTWVPLPPPPSEVDACDRISSHGSDELDDPPDCGTVEVERQLETMKLSLTRRADLAE